MYKKIQYINVLKYFALHFFNTSINTSCKVGLHWDDIVLFGQQVNSLKIYFNSY